MIKKLRRKFIIITMCSVILVMAALVGTINGSVYLHVVKRADIILQMLSDNGGTFPDKPAGGASTQPLNDPKSPAPSGDIGSANGSEGVGGGGSGKNSWLMYLNDNIVYDSSELAYETRYFSVNLTEDNTTRSIDTGRISAVDSDQAADYAREVVESGKKSGFIDDYRYLVTDLSDGTLIIFYDCGRSLDNARSFIAISVIISLICLVSVFALITLASGIVIRPIAETYEKQRRFITDAGHELKTPLAIINADTDVLELESGDSDGSGDNEWLADIRRQTQRLTELTSELIMLAKTEEGGRKSMVAVEFPVSDVIAETAESYKAPAQLQNKKFNCDIEQGLAMTGDPKMIGQLVGIFLDNAVKYTPDGGRIDLKLARNGRNIVLNCKNTTQERIPKDKLKHLFDRFYRTDESRNSGTGGYGIGLSIAKTIVETHKGKISASCGEGNLLIITVVLPS